MRDQGLDREEAHVAALHTSGKTQSTGQMGFARPAVPDDQHILVAIRLLAHHQFPNELLVDRRLSGEVEGIQGLEDREAGVLDSAFRRSFLPIQGLPFHQTQQEAGTTMFWCRIVLLDDVSTSIFGLRKNGNTGVSDAHWVGAVANINQYEDLGPIGVDANLKCEYYGSNVAFATINMVVTAYST